MLVMKGTLPLFLSEKNGSQGKILKPFLPIWEETLIFHNNLTKREDLLVST